MSHFLHQLRSDMENRNNAEKRYSHKRRQQNNRRGMIYDRRTNAESKKSHHHKNDQQDRAKGIPRDALSGIKTILHNIATNQERLISIEERKARAMEKISEGLNKISKLPLSRTDEITEQVQLFEELGPKKRLNKSEDPNRTRVIEIIDEMRKENATYSDIAERLQSEDLPTFSGRGKWHAQTVHRLCSE